MNSVAATGGASRAQLLVVPLALGSPNGRLQGERVGSLPAGLRGQQKKVESA
jgi:hypothetical protein